MEGHIDYISNARPLSEAELAASGAFFQKRSGVSVACLEGPEARVGGARVLLWRGDITTLAVDAIVNAANSAGLGCFQSGHRCIDNVIHSVAGPRLREACRALLQGRDLAVGTEPIVTPGFFLPCSRVVHVTGPQLRQGAAPSPLERSQLARAYMSVLEACAREKLRSVAFCCLSTGVFGYPGAPAARVAIAAVRDWLVAHPGAIDTVVFDTFTPADHAIYLALYPRLLVPRPNVSRAKALIAAAPAVLVIAGAGMSVYPPGGPNVYVDRAAFAQAYPDMPARGYSTAYECMSLFGKRRDQKRVIANNRQGDPDVSLGAKWGFLARHALNMRFRWAPCAGYELLKSLLSPAQDVFVWTSNVDGCFERAGGFAEIYTPQGDFGRLQCSAKCSPSSVFPAKSILEGLVAQLDDRCEVPESSLPKCAHCGGPLRANVRGGDWFLPSPDDLRLQQRVRAFIERHPSLVVLEIGAGRNTPIVTRFPAEAIVRESQAARALIRINPEDCGVPEDLAACSVSLAGGWQVLRDIAQEQQGGTQAPMEALDAENTFHADWRFILDKLQ
jgi:O-acetyl-ADP-ribose deacetylase (regulator of RNase III)/NAD-dependent SIR2 family protein deacetylase